MNSINNATESHLISHTQLAIPYSFAPCSGADVLIGVPENYNGIFPWYLAKVRRFSLLLFTE